MTQVKIRRKLYHSIIHILAYNIILTTIYYYKIKMTYNQKRHVQLLKRSQDLDNQGKDLYRENPEEFLELSKYNLSAICHIAWQEGYHVALFVLMEDFLNKKIEGEFMCDRVCELRRKLGNTSEKFLLELLSSSEKIQDFQPDGEAINISSFLTNLYCVCDGFDEDYESEVFYSCIKTRFLDFQKALNEE